MLPVPPRDSTGPRARRAVLTCGFALALVGVGPSVASGQDSCVAGDLGRNDVFLATVPGLGRITYVSGAHFVCEGGGQIWADSAVVYDSRSLSEFIGSFRYVDGSRELLADGARYFFDLERLQAEGNVSLRDEEAGSSITNGDLVLMMANSMREEESMTVTIGSDGRRPVAVLSPPVDSTALEPAGPPTPYTVTGDRIDLRGASSFAATGDVEIVRDSLLAFADSVEYDQLLGDLLLSGSARVEGEGYDLEGRAITMDSPGAASSTLRAVRDARLTGTDLLLTSAQIVVYMVDDALERLVAIPITRGVPRAGDPPADSADLVLPRATVDDFVLTADSLEVLAPGESIERVFAAGRARSTSRSRDTLNVASLPEVARTDWLEGDTVIVTFRTLEPDASVDAVVDSLDGVAPGGRDARPRREVEAIVARVRARSLYRLEASDTTARVGIDPPAVHYVVGDEIRIEMVEGEVRGMQVKGQTRGVHLEPLRRAAPVASTDSANTDTLVTDTLGIAPGGVPEGRDAPSAASPDDTPTTPTVPSGVNDAPREEKPWTRR